MLELYFATSPNVLKVVIALEELNLIYRLVPVDLSKGEQHDPALLGGAITAKVPVLRDDAPSDSGPPLVLAESGAIMFYLGEKFGRYIGAVGRPRTAVMQWLFWQMAGLGPISGQTWHFEIFAPLLAPHADHDYGRRRYQNMLSALWRVMERQLTDQHFLAGDYSMADMACFPWVSYLHAQEGIAAYPAIERWHDAIAARPAVRRALGRYAEIDTGYARNAKGVSLFPWDGLVANVIVT